MFVGTKEGNTGGGNYLKTGLSSFNLLGINPSASQIQEWTGRDNVQEPNYDLVEDFNQKQVRPIHFWLKNQDETVVNFRLNIGQDEAIAKSGNYQVCTSTGAVVWAKSAGVVKPEFADHAALKIGEADLIEFVSKLINFDQKSGENLYEQMTKLGVDATSLYNASYAGMNKLATWSQEKEKTIVMCLIVREKTVDVDGTPTVKRYQAVASDSKTWFHGQVTDWAEKKLLERYEKSLEVGAGQTQAYPIIKDLFTIKYQDFKREDCYNAVPDNPTTTGGANIVWKS